MNIIYLLIATLCSFLISCAAPARLDEASRTIAGTVTYRSRIALPADAEIVVEARDSAGKLLAEKTMPTQGRQPPFPYALQIHPNVGATLRAGIHVGGQARWASDPMEIAAGSGPDDGLEIVVKPFRPMGFASRLRCGETDVILGAVGPNAVLEVGGERFELAPVQSAAGKRFEAKGDPETFLQTNGGQSLVSIKGKTLRECSDVETPPESGASDPKTSGSGVTRGANNERVDAEQAGMAHIGDLPASYEGELSCPGCEGIRYRLNLLTGYRYILRATYEGTGYQADTSGDWRFLADGMELALAADGARGHHLFAVEEGVTLRWLDKRMESASPLKRRSAYQAIEPRAAQATDGLEDALWKLNRLNDAPLALKPKQPVPHLTLNSLDHNVNGHSGCNLLTGHYRLDDTRLEFGKMATTRRACMPGMEIEQRFLAALERVKAWRLDGLKLELLDANGKPIARFEKEMPKPSPRYHRKPN